MDEKSIEPRYIDAAIIEQGRTVYNMIMPKKSGGLGGYLYVCGSVSLYETVMLGIKQAMYNSRNVTKSQAEELISTAFSERRFMLGKCSIFLPNVPTLQYLQLYNVLAVQMFKSRGPNDCQTYS
jgi:hypothetical protein